MKRPERRNRRWAAMALAAALLSGLCALSAGCATSAIPSRQLGAFSTNRADAKLAEAVRNDPFPTAAQSGVASVASTAR